MTKAFQYAAVHVGGAIGKLDPQAGCHFGFTVRDGTPFFDWNDKKAQGVRALATSLLCNTEEPFERLWAGHRL